MKYQVDVLVSEWEQFRSGEKQVSPDRYREIVTILSNVPEVLGLDAKSLKIPTVEFMGANC